MRVYFLGIGGIGVSALAQYYLFQGHKVMGSDIARTEITEMLEGKGIKVEITNSKSQIPNKFQIQNSKSKKERGADLVVYSPAVPQNNSELQNFRKQGIECLSYPEALGQLTKQYFTIAISGTHGKSTTTAMLALVMIKAGLDPTVIVGTKLKEFGDSNFRAGQSKYFVIEADEHFGSFLHYWSKIIVLTNIEPEHLDYYKNLDNVLKAYKEYIGHLQKDGVLVGNGEDENINKIFNFQFSIFKQWFDFTHHLRFSIFNFQTQKKEVKKLKQILKVPGEHNVKNALAVLAVARELKIPDKISFSALSEFQGTWRRMEEFKLQIGPPAGGCKLQIVSDYGHHPTEIKATIQAIKEKYPNKKVWLVFQPHQYQRTFYLFKDFVKAFQGLNLVKTIITDIFEVVGREEGNVKQKVSAEKLVKAINKKNVSYLTQEDLLSFLRENIAKEKCEVLIIMGAGNIYQIIEQLNG